MSKRRVWQKKRKKRKTLTILLVLMVFHFIVKSTTLNHYPSMNIDSRAFEHISGNVPIFQSLHECSKFSISLPNGEVQIVSLKGDVSISNDITLINVYIVPSFWVKLLYVSKLTSTTDFVVQFSKSCASIFDKIRMKNPSLIDVREGLYFLPNAKGRKYFVGAITSSTWHKRLGHTSLVKLKFVLWRIALDTSFIDFSNHYSVWHFVNNLFCHFLLMHLGHHTSLNLSTWTFGGVSLLPPFMGRSTF